MILPSQIWVLGRFLIKEKKSNLKHIVHNKVLVLLSHLSFPKDQAFLQHRTGAMMASLGHHYIMVVM